jgi:hypothetical protein
MLPSSRGDPSASASLCTAACWTSAAAMGTSGRR